MFTASSRYFGLGTYSVTLADGRTVTATTLPVSERGALLGYHPKVAGDRLDLLAARYLKEPTGFWRLCDANSSFSPDALIARELVGIPSQAKRR
jgi:hypothetical protein